MGNVKLKLRLSGEVVELPDPTKDYKEGDQELQNTPIPHIVTTEAEWLRRKPLAFEMFETGRDPLPTGHAVAATNVAGTTATLNGYIEPGNGSCVVEFEHWKDATPETVTTIAADESPLAENDPKAFDTVSKAITGLTASTAHSYRIKATNAAGIFYSNVIGFTTTA